MHIAYQSYRIRYLFGKLVITDLKRKEQEDTLQLMMNSYVQFSVFNFDEKGVRVKDKIEHVSMVSMT